MPAVHPDAAARPQNPFVPFPRAEIERNLVARFEAQVNQHALSPAVLTPEVEWSYAELNARANTIAQAMLERTGRQSEPVCLFLDQGAPLVAAILGALKAGKFYVPLDPTHPVERSRELLAFVGARLVLTAQPHLPIAAQLGVQPPNLRIVDELLAAPDNTNPALPIQPHDPAYVFFTSGTTGQPKGVLDNHRNVLHNVMRYTNALHVCPADRLTLVQAATFSGTVSSLFSALLNGACLLPFDVRAEGFVRLAEWMKAARATIYHSVPAIYREVVQAGESFPDVRVVRLEGDQASRSDLELFRGAFPANSCLANGLGTTETGLCRQFFAHQQTQLTGDALPIGYPLPDLEMSVLRADGTPAAPGEIGELVVTSEFLAVGYWRNDELTRARFRSAGSKNPRRVYHTGDLGRMAADGCLEYLGRASFEEKINGQWVDCAALEHALQTTPGIRDAAVVTRADATGATRLAAFVIPHEDAGWHPMQLRARLAEQFPSQPIPTAFSSLPALPLNEHGKVDRAALRARPLPAESRSTAFVAPATELERLVATAWEEILKVRPVGMTDNFFELGGESLKAARLAAKLEQQLGCSLSPSTFLKHPTIAQFLQELFGHPAGN